MKIKTELLQKMIVKAIQGASNNKMIPLTSLIGIEFKDRNLVLITTDGSNQFKINNKFEDIELPGMPQEFYTIVNAETFAKLVGKTVGELIELNNNQNYLEVVTDKGKYKLEIAINEEGEMVKFPEIKEIDVEPYSISTKLLQEAIKTSKASVAKTMEVPCLTGYYLSNNMITTDRQMICLMKNQLVKEPMLISSEMAELLLLVDEETTNVLHKDNDLIFFNRDFKIAGKELEGKENYPVQQIENLTRLDYTNTIKVDKQELLGTLSRLSIFISDYDKNGVYLKFSNDGLTLQSQKSNAIEKINAIEINDIQSFECLIDITMLQREVEVVSTDIVELQYGQDKSIRIIDGNTSFIISLLEKQN